MMMEAKKLRHHLIPVWLTAVMAIATLGSAACADAGSKLTTQIGKTEEQAQKTVQDLLAANRSLSEPTAVHRPEHQEDGGPAWPFKPRTAHAQVPAETPAAPATLENPTPQTKQQAEIGAIKQRWEPLYGAAKDSFDELDEQLAYSEQYAADYFKQQLQYIEDLRGGAENARTIETTMSNAYNRQVRYYEDWKSAAYDVKRQCQRMLDNMHNVDVLIKFTADAADFQALLDEQLAVPSEITALNAAMTDLQRKTEGVLSELARPETEGSE